MKNRCGIPILRSLPQLIRQTDTFKGRCVWPPVIAEEATATCDRLRRMQAELNDDHSQVSFTDAVLDGGAR